LWSMMHPLTPQVRCVALSNPLLGLFTPPPQLKVFFGRLASKILPKLSLPNELNPEHISRDPKVVSAYLQDPAVFNTITTRWADEMMKAMEDVHRYASSYTYPLRLMLGGADKICDPESSKELAAAYGGDIETIVYEQCYHELFNEPEKWDILEDTALWLHNNFGE
jgi:lysophospholipase